MRISLTLLGIAMKDLPVGTAHAVWTGVGTVGTFLLGIFLFGEPAAAGAGCCVRLILADDYANPSALSASCTAGRAATRATYLLSSGQADISNFNNSDQRNTVKR